MTSISADGSSNNIYLQMDTSNNAMQYSIGSTPGIPSWVTISVWPVTITNSNPSSTSILDVIVTQNLTITSSYGDTSGYFIAGTDYITFDGSGNTLTLDTITGYPGFIDNYNTLAESKANIIVQNFTTSVIGSSTLSFRAGWLCQRNFGRGSSGNQIIGCTNTGDIRDGTQSGGIVGGDAANDVGGSLLITNCTNSGTIDFFSGGIAGNSSGAFGGLVSFIGCTNSGDILNVAAGGIAGFNVGNDGSANFIGCTNSGLISGDNAGGIAGDTAGKGSSGSATFTGCTNTGDIMAIAAGGIAGGSVGTISGSATFTDCTNTGNIIGNQSGGIVGSNAGLTNGSASFTNCANTGIISGDYAGGIVGVNFAYNTTTICSITNCYSIGNITGNNAGGITGADIGYTNSLTYTPKIVDISNCYTLGDIASTCGGICGGTIGFAYSGTPTINITNCYSWGNITDASSGIVSTSLPISTNQNNIYVADGSWSDASANANLTGFPTDISTNNPGPTWTTIETNNITPYVLSSFNAEVYDPSFASSATNYTTDPGLFLDSSYNLLYNDTSGNVATTRVFVSKGTPSPYYYSYNNNTFTFTNTGTLSDIINASINTSNGEITYLMSPICFKEGTKILCENDVYIPVEELKIGDLVKTYNHGYQKVIMTAHSNLWDYSQNMHNQLYTYPREKNPDLIEELHLTGGHSLLVDALTEEESTNMQNINWAKEDFMVEDKYKLLSWYNEKLSVSTEQNVEIYHFTLEPPENAKPNYVYGIYANGILAESCSKGAMEQVCNNK